MWTVVVGTVLPNTRLGQRDSALSLSCLDHHVHGWGKENGRDGTTGYTPFQK